MTSQFAIGGLCQAAHSPGLIPEDKFLRLPRRSLGQILKHHRLWCHVVWQPLPAEANDLGFRGTGAVLELHERARRLAPVVVWPRHDRRLEHRRVAEDHRLHLDRADVLATRYDDVLGPVLELDVPVRMPHGEVPGVQPPAGHRFLRPVEVLVVPAHHGVASEHHLAHGLPVVRHALHRVRVLDVDALHRDVVEPLPRLQPRALLRRQRVPLRHPRADGRRAVRLREAVDLVHHEAELLHREQDARRRRRPARHDAHGPRQRLAVRGRRVGDHVEHRRSAAHVRDPVARDAVEDDLGREVAEADVGAALHRDAPREVPAVAVEHGHGPQVGGHGGDVVREDGGDGVEVRAAVVVDHALGPRRRAGRVVERDRVQLVRRPPDVEPRGGVPDEILVVVGLGVVRDGEENREGGGAGVGEALQRGSPDVEEVRLDEEHLGAGVLEQGGHHGRVVPRVERAEDRAGHGHGEVQLVHRRHVWAEDSDLRYDPDGVSERVEATIFAEQNYTQYCMG
jgi:hypothetical protein